MKRNLVPPTLRKEVYSFGFHEVGSVTEWEEMWKRYTSATSAQEKQYIIHALSKSEDIWLLQRSHSIFH